MAISLSFSPVDFGIARHLRRPVHVSIGPNGPVGPKMRLAVPWSPGDVSNEGRAAHQARMLLAEAFQRKFTAYELGWQSPAMRKEQKVVALEIPPGLAGFDYGLPALVKANERLFLNPTPHRFDPKDIRTLKPIGPAEIDFIELTDTEQPLRYPLSGNGLYYFLDTGWSNAKIGSSEIPTLSIVIVGYVTREYHLTGLEAYCQMNFIVRYGLELTDMLDDKTAETARVTNQEIEIHTIGNVSDADRAEFYRGFRELFPLIAKSLSHGIRERIQRPG